MSPILRRVGLNPHIVFKAFKYTIYTLLLWNVFLFFQEDLAASAQTFGDTISWRNNSDDFVFDTQFLAQSVTSGFRLADIPVPVRYFEEASSINFRRSSRYGLLTLWVMLLFWLNRLGLYKSVIFQPEKDQ